MKKTTFTRYGYTCRIWLKGWTKLWGWEIRLGDRRIDSGARASWWQAARAVLGRVEQLPLAVPKKPVDKRYLIEKQVAPYKWVPYDADADLYALLERTPRQDGYRVLDLVSKGMKSASEFHNLETIRRWKSQQHTRWCREGGAA